MALLLRLGDSRGAGRSGAQREGCAAGASLRTARDAVNAGRGSRQRRPCIRARRTAHQASGSFADPYDRRARRPVRGLDRRQQNEAFALALALVVALPRRPVPGVAEAGASAAAAPPACSAACPPRAPDAVPAQPAAPAAQPAAPATAGAAAAPPRREALVARPDRRPRRRPRHRRADEPPRLRRRVRQHRHARCCWRSSRSSRSAS